MTEGATVEPLRIGVLGAARITALSLVEPARATGHRLVAVAARSTQRAAAFAAEHGIERVHETYADVIADPDVEAVYNPLPNALHDIDPDMPVNIEHEDQELDQLEGLRSAAETLLEADRRRQA